jgi:protein involved in polysaccharide export with SLBB domain
MKASRLLLQGLAIFLIAVPACVLAQQPSAMASAAATTAVNGGAGQGQGAQPELEHRNPRYKVQRSDVLSISFPLSPELDQDKLTVQPDGYITMPEVGGVYVQDLTVPEVVEALKKAYANILHDPIIDVDLIDFQKPYFTVEGQVGKPGEYELRHDTTVAEGIAMAGGLSPTAKTQIFLLHRVSAGWVEVKKLDVKDVLNGKKANEDAYLSSGDMIVIPENFISKFRKYVPYGLGTSVGYGFY